MIGPTVCSTHGSGAVDVHLIPTPRDDEVYHMPVFGTQYIIHHDKPMLSQVSHGPGQAVFVMYRFIYISFRINISAKCLTLAMDRVTIPIQAVILTFGAVLKLTFSKLPTSNVGRGDRGENITGYCRVRSPQIAKMFLNYNVAFEYPGMF